MNAAPSPSPHTALEALAAHIGRLGFLDLRDFAATLDESFRKTGHMRFAVLDTAAVLRGDSR